MAKNVLGEILDLHRVVTVCIECGNDIKDKEHCRSCGALPPTPETVCDQCRGEWPCPTVLLIGKHVGEVLA